MAARPKKRNGSKQTVKLIHSKTSKFRHLRLVRHSYTGKLLPHRHTSYAGLACILLALGLFIFASQGMANAASQSVSHDVTINGVVPGPPPTIGATITTPADGTIFTDQTLVEVDGSCAAGSFVVVSSNNSTVGSANCTSAGSFTMTVQLDIGTDVLSARNYDSLNQAGPSTPNITVTVKTTTAAPTAPAPTQGTSTSGSAATTTGTSSGASSITSPTLNLNPAKVFSLNDSSSNCDNQPTIPLPQSVLPKVAITCIPRFFEANQVYTMQIAAWGGVKPYALSIDWGDGKQSKTTIRLSSADLTNNPGLISLADASYKTISFKYVQAGSYLISIKMEDAAGNQAYVQSATVVTGEVKPMTLGIAAGDAISHLTWFDSPIPIYLLVVALTLGFWGGDLFDKRFGITKRFRHS